MFKKENNAPKLLSLHSLALIFMIRIILLIVLFTGIVCRSNAQENTVADNNVVLYEFGKVHIPKISPIINLQQIRGGILSYETGGGFRRISVNLALRYFTGVDSTERVLPVRSHFRAEIQPRIWYKRIFYGAFASPLLVVNDKGEFAAGVVLGFQHEFKNHVILEFFTGLQSRTPTDQVDSGVFFLKYGLNLGYKFAPGN